MNDDYIWKESYFPIKIQYMDTEEFRICNDPEDIESGRSLKVIQCNVGENRDD